jgi:hypothetical protein
MGDIEEEDDPSTTASSRCACARSRALRGLVTAQLAVTESLRCSRNRVQVERVVQSSGRRRVARVLQGRRAAAAPGSHGIAVCPRFARGAAGSSENNRGARVRGQAAARHLCRVQQRALRRRPFQNQAKWMGSVDRFLCIAAACVSCIAAASSAALHSLALLPVNCHPAPLVMQECALGRTGRNTRASGTTVCPMALAALYCQRVTDSTESGGTGRAMVSES